MSEGHPQTLDIELRTERQPDAAVQQLCSQLRFSAKSMENHRHILEPPSEPQQLVNRTHAVYHHRQPQRACQPQLRLESSQLKVEVRPQTVESALADHPHLAPRRQPPHRLDLRSPVGADLPRVQPDTHVRQSVERSVGAHTDDGRHALALLASMCMEIKVFHPFRHRFIIVFWYT